MKISIPDKAKQVISGLEAAGFEAYVVGGCVRDACLGREAADWDITTDALPGEVKSIFPKTVDTGIQHGTVTVIIGGEGFEVTTYRVDGEYHDGRHPESVTFTRSLKEDLKRRDFTINAMAYNDTAGLVDIFGGLGDLGDKKIRCVGDPKERFDEDALRIMRAVRFAAQLGFEIEEETYQALSEFAPRLALVSVERIQVELVKLLVSPHPDYVRLLWKSGITAVILPEFDACMDTPQNNPHHCYSVGEHILHSLTEIPAEKHLRTTMLLHDIGKPACKTTDAQGVDHFKKHAAVGSDMADGILRRLKFDNDTRKKVVRLVRSHDDLHDVPTKKAVRRAVNRIGTDLFPDYILVRRADIMAQSPAFRDSKLQNLEILKSLYARIIEDGECVELKSLAVKGQDLIDLGFTPGPEIGEMLDRLLEKVLEHPEYNRKDILLNKALQMKV